MNPPGVEESLKLTGQYGIANVMAIMLVLSFLAAFFLILRWVFKTTNEREISTAAIINIGMANITEALKVNTILTQQISQNLKDGFDTIKTAGDHQRDEHTQMIRLIENCTRLK